MRNFSDAQSAVQTALNSTNSAMEENARYMESIQAKTNKLAAEFQKLIIGDGGLEKFAKTMLDVATASIQLIESLGGLQSIFTALISVGLIVAINNFETLAKSSKKLIGVFADMGKTLKDTVDKWIEMQINEALYLETTDAAIISTNMLKLSLGALVAVVSLAIIAFNAYQQAQEKATKIARDTVNAALDESEALQQQLNNLEKENQSREDLVKAIQATDSAYKDEGQSLDEINKKRQEAIDKLKEEGEEALKNARNGGFGQYLKDRDILQSGYRTHEFALGTNTRRAIATSQGAFEGNTSEEYLAYLEKYQQHLTDLGRSNSKLNEEIQSLKNEIAEAKNGVETYDNVLLQLGQVYDTVTGKIKALLPSEIGQNDTITQLNNLTAEQIGILDEWGVSIDEISDKMEDADVSAFIEALGSGDLETAVALLEQYGIEIKNVSNESADAISDFLSITEDLQSAYETLNKAAEEYNKNGYISAATLKKLAKLDADYQAQLEITNGTMTVTNGALQDQFNLSKQLAIIHAKTETETEALAYAQGYLADNIVTVGTDSKESQPKVSELSQAFTDLGHVTQEANKGIWAVRNALGDEEALEKFNKGLEEIYNRGAKRVENLEGIELDYASSSKSSASSHKDAWKEAFEEEQRLLKHSLEMNEITEIEYYEKLKDLNEKYFGEVSGNHKKYLKEYQENEEEIYKGLKSIYDKVRDYLKEAVEQGYEKAINAIKKEEKKLLAEIKSQIEALKKEKKHVLDGIKDEVNALKRQKEEAQKYYNDQIDALKRENEEIEQQNELLEYQQALQQAKSKKVMVFQEGKFQLTEDESAVAQAEQNLAQYQNKAAYEKQIQELEDLRDATVESIEERIQALEDYYDYMEDYYDKRIESMEEYYNQVQDQYEKQIEALQEQLDAFKEGYQKQEDLENARLAAQVLGINERSLLYEQDLENLKNYINSTNKMLESLGEAGVTVSSDYKGVQVSTQGVSKIGSVDSSVKRRAKGDASFSGDEIALVGESPNAEIVLGSHLNRSLGGGSLMNLARGSGVVNAESTATLAGLLNGLTNPTSVSNSRTTQQNFSFGAITLPNVTDANSFVKTLSTQFNNYAIQYGNR